jgi:hypothetical protein
VKFGFIVKHRRIWTDLDRGFEALAPNRKWIAEFANTSTAEADFTWRP